MRSKYVVLAFIVFALYFGCSQAATYAASYAFVDVAKVFDEYQKTKDNDKTLQEAGKAKEAEREAKVNEIRKMKDELELLSDDAKKSKQEAIDAKVRELQEFDLAVRKDLGEKRDQIVREIFNDIDQVVQKYGKEKKLDFVINDKALLYQDQKLNVTEEILSEVNKGYKKK